MSSCFIYSYHSDYSKFLAGRDSSFVKSDNFKKSLEYLLSH